MRKVMTPILAGVLALSLTGCIPSGNIVGKAEFTTYASGSYFNPSDEFAKPGDIAKVEINGGTVATPKGLRYRINKASLAVNGNYIIAAPNNFLEPSSPISKDEFVAARLKGKNVCGSISGFTVDGARFWAVLEAPQKETQTLWIFADNGLYWIGNAPANSLKVGGRNLCGDA